MVSQFRPIALYNVFIKVVTKIIANILKLGMEKLTGDT